jgi:hypothetical protein
MISETSKVMRMIRSVGDWSGSEKSVRVYRPVKKNSAPDGRQFEVIYMTKE